MEKRQKLADLEVKSSGPEVESSGPEVESSAREVESVQTDDDKEIKSQYEDPNLEKFSFKDLTLEEKNQVVSTMLKHVEARLPPYNPLFELFSVCVVEFKGEGEGEGDRRGELFGFIEGFDPSGLVIYYRREPEESQPICKNELVPLIGPDPCSLSASDSLELVVELYVQFGDKELQVSNTSMTWEFSSPRYFQYYDCFRCYDSPGQEGCVKVYYIALRFAVQTTLEVSFRTPGGGPLDVYGNIVAYYGNFDYNCSPSDKDFYRAILFDRPKGKSALLETGKIPLIRSVLAVPSKGSLVIEAHLWDFEGKNEILGGTFEFPSKLKDSSTGCIEGQGCSVDLKVDWKCKAVA